MRRRVGLWDAVTLSALYRLLRTERFDLVHTHSSKGGFLGRMAARACRTPVVHTPNGLYFLEKSGMSRQFYLNLERLAGHVTTAMVAVSDDERNVLTRHNIIDPTLIRVIPNGVDTTSIHREAELTQEEAKSRLGISASQHIVGAVGRLVPQKAPMVFVRAAQQVASEIPVTLFLWVGSGPMQAEVEAQARDRRVPLRLMGHREDVWPIMRAFDVFVLASQYEGLSFALLEAMALGLPVVVTDVVGAREAVQDEVSGLVVPPNDPTSLAQAILSLLKHPQWARRLAVAGEKRVVTQFSTKQMLDRHRALYLELLGAGRIDRSAR
jgi:glycosyltransferase involved in cell wall biosynthesis